MGRRIETQPSLTQVVITDTSGKVWSTELHRDWSEEDWRNLVGRVADLKGAYKQLPVFPGHQAFSVLAVKRPYDQAVMLFETKSLMFGQSAAVYGFLRFSRAIAAIAAVTFNLLVVEFFDDFSQVEPKQTSKSAQVAMESLINILGWQLSMSEEKRKDFAKEFVALGVSIDLTNVVGQEIILRNKEGRIAGISEQVNLVCDSGMGFKDALSIRGKIFFAEGQLFGRISAPVIRMLSIWAKNKKKQLPPDHFRLALKELVVHLSEAGPRVIGSIRTRRPVLVFTDGACEDITSVGGVAFFPDGRVEFFGAVMSQEVVDSWKSKEGQQQVIGQAEIYPVLVARLTWANDLSNERVIWFLDNESARLGLIKAYSPVLPSLEIICKALAWDYKHKSDGWHARVPTASNPGDDPSRMVSTNLVREYGARAVKPVFPVGDRASRVL